MAMWIRQLDVADCAGIKTASVALQPGLNVLHGPNELGKSTLVKAIRATLLLPAGSTAAESLRAWNIDGAPSVVLTFEQEAQRIWRIRKRFGRSGGQTYLDFSRDGQAFSQESRGREVEGAVQNILRWGIEPPGGKGRRHGMPESFIATALLGDQRDIDAILEASLADDPSASGRDRLTDALQALAEDPRLKQVLASVQERFDEAFTGTGRRRGGRGSPWSRLREDRIEAEQREQRTRQEVEQSESVRARVAELQQHALDAEAEAERTAGELKAERRAERLRAERAAAAKALAEAAEALKKAQAQVRSKDEKTVEVTAAAKQIETLRVRLKAAEQALAAVQPLAKAATDRVRQLESGDAEQSRRLRVQEARNRQLRLTHEKTALEARVSAARNVAEREASVRGVRSDIEQCAKALAEQRGLLADAKAKSAEDASEIEALERERACVRYATARDKAAALIAERDAVQALAKTAQSLENQAQEARAKAKALNVPARAELDEIKRLHADSRVANGKLAVGLSLEFMPETAGTADVTQDGETSQRQFDVGSRLRFEAERELRLAIDGFGVIEVRGGGRHLRDEAKEASDRWRRLADSLFDRASVASTAELEAKREEADQLSVFADQRDSDAKQARARSDHVDEVEQQAAVAQAEAVQRRQAAAECMDASVSVDEYIKERGELRTEEALTDAIDALKAEVTKRDALQLASNVEVAAAQERAMHQDLERRQQELDDLTAANDGWRSVLDEAAANRERLDEELAKADAEIRAIQAEATAAAEDAHEALAKARAEKGAKTKARDDAAQALQSAENALARLSGESEAMRTAMAALDVPALQAVRDRKQSELDALPVMEDAPKDLAELERQANDARGQADSLRNELSTAQGALSQVGGQRIEEQAAQAKEALAALARREHELEVEYGGWKLLLDTLAEAEREDATHLGDALVKPVSERMAALTNGRYSEVGIGPQLDATGIRLGEAERSFDDVSVGTREQVALLLRLAIAEALGSFVILDDHLTQSDPRRMAWIRGLLSEAAQNIQVVVMTCHPDAYLTGDSGGDVHAVDLMERIERHPIARPARSSRRPEAPHPAGA